MYDSFDPPHSIPPRYRAPFLNHIVSRFPSPSSVPRRIVFQTKFQSVHDVHTPCHSAPFACMIVSRPFKLDRAINSLRVVKTFRCCAHVFVALSLESKQHDSRRKSENAIITALPLIAPTYYSTGFIESRHRGAKDSW